jgi:hypothetical protein
MAVDDTYIYLPVLKATNGTSDYTTHGIEVRNRDTGARVEVGDLTQKDKNNKTWKFIKLKNSPVGYEVEDIAFYGK